VSVACIGPAGESLIPIAVIMNDDHRAAGRAGLGAIMGSKKLKAIVVSGRKRVTVAKPEQFKSVAARCLDAMKKNGVTGTNLPKYGTAVLVKVVNDIGALPYRNWQSGIDPNAGDISGQVLSKKYLVKKRPCWGCSIGCGRVTAVKSGPFQVLRTEGPEYESYMGTGKLMRCERA